MVAFEPNNKENIFPGEEPPNEQETEKIIFFIMQNVIEELLSLEDKCYVAKVDDRIVAIINYASIQSTENYKNKIQKSFSEGQAFIFKNFNFSFSAAASSVRQGESNLILAYNEAICALNFIKLSDNDIIFYDEIHRRGSQADDELYKQFYEKEKGLISVIKNGDYKTAKRMTEGIFEQCVTYMNVEITHVFMLSLANTILQTMDLGQTEHKGELIGKITATMNFNDISTVYGSILSLLEMVCGLATESKAEKMDDSQSSDDIVPQIIDYIRAHYDDDSLSIASMSDHFHFSSYYISKIFKKVTGEGLLDFIGKLRVDKAKELMRDSDIPLVDIYSMVGFNNEKTFVRTFTKYSAITPSKYKKYFCKE